MAWGVIVVLILGPILYTIAIIVAISLSKSLRKIDVNPNAPKIEIHSRTIRSFTDQYYSGIIKTQIQRKNGTTFIEFYPDDVEQTDVSPRPDIESFVINDEFIKRISPGDLSGRREIIIILPRSKWDLPEKMRDTLEGEAMTKQGQLAFIISVFGDKLIQAGDEALKQAMKNYARGSITKEDLEEMKQEIEMLKKIKTIPTEKESGKPSPQEQKY